MLKEWGGGRAQRKTGAPREVEEGGVWTDNGGGSYGNRLDESMKRRKNEEDDGRWFEGHGGGVTGRDGAGMGRGRVRESQLRPPSSILVPPEGLIKHLRHKHLSQGCTDS